MPRRPKVRTIPYDPRVAEAIAQGVPVPGEFVFVGDPPAQEGRMSTGLLQMGAVLAKPEAGMQESETIAAREIESIVQRLDIGIAEERKAMDALLSRLRSTRIAA